MGGGEKVDDLKGSCTWGHLWYKVTEEKSRSKKIDSVVKSELDQHCKLYSGMVSSTGHTIQSGISYKAHRHASIRHTHTQYSIFHIDPPLYVVWPTSTYFDPTHTRTEWPYECVKTWDQFFAKARLDSHSLESPPQLRCQGLIPAHVASSSFTNLSLLVCFTVPYLHA